MLIGGEALERREDVPPHTRRRLPLDVFRQHGNIWPLFSDRSRQPRWGSRAGPHGDSGSTSGVASRAKGIAGLPSRGTYCGAELPRKSLHTARVVLRSAPKYALGMRSDPPFESGPDAPQATPQSSKATTEASFDDVEATRRADPDLAAVRGHALETHRKRMAGLLPKLR